MPFLDHPLQWDLTGDEQERGLPWHLQELGEMSPHVGQGMLSLVPGMLSLAEEMSNLVPGMLSLVEGTSKLVQEILSLARTAEIMLHGKLLFSNNQLPYLRHILFM